ncbi:hypothetical protein IAI58_22280 (plasmid) [Roseomonas marmotae]|uniref:Uncharacterized protein n=1 Tax=Roseomonas marmotae TaxID=2768161 RepID=A0ABS3KI57_9PROT|nr:hypothetical protein [Roseomonas marmotae]MBO1077134.1 hypothetical protein [Roseomonas marmotae]QTI82086.1 hypothetical protein IAI58_22280 [Roseomonas marmotae]
MHFVDPGLYQPVPDAKTTWLYREQLKRADAIDGLFRRWAVTDAAQHDSRKFPDLLDPRTRPAASAADTAYRIKRNLEVLERRDLSEHIQFLRAPQRGLSEQQAKAYDIILVLEEPL